MQPIYCTPVGEVLRGGAVGGRRNGLLQTVARVTGHRCRAFDVREHKSSRKRYKLKEYLDGRGAAAPGGTAVIRRANSDRLKRVSHAGRLAAMGHLAAYVAHELN